MARTSMTLFALMLGLVSAAVQEQGVDANVNPIRKVVGMLQGIEKKINAEGEKEEKLFEEFMCYCKTTRADLKQSISQNSDSVPQVHSDLDEAQSKLKQSETALAGMREDVEAVKQAVEDAEKQRKDNNAEYKQASADFKGTLDATTSAIKAMQKGMAGKKQTEGEAETEASAFLQGQAALKEPLLKAAATTSSLNDDERTDVISFLSDGINYTPKGSHILPVLQKMQADAQEGYDRVNEDEAEQVKTFTQLKEAKKKQRVSLMTSIQKKNELIGELRVSIVQLRGDAKRGDESLATDQKALEDLEDSCTKKEAETKERTKTRNEEKKAITETISMLNSDDALELFKKTLPSPSLLQLETSASMYRTQLRGVVRALQDKVPSQPELGLLAMKLDTGSESVATVSKSAVEVINGLLDLLKQEQVDDDAERDSCKEHLQQGQLKIAELKKHLKDLGYDVEDKHDVMETFDGMIKDLAAGIKRLDKTVDAATAQRKEQHEEYVASAQQNQAAVELLGMAAKRLGEFYNLLQQQADDSASDADSIRLLPSMSFLQIHSSQMNRAESQHRSALKEMETVSEKGGKIIAILKQLVFDMEEQMKENKHEEENSQKDYEKLLEDAKAKREEDARSITAKQGMKAEAEQAYVGKKHTLADETEEEHDAEDVDHDLHEQCDWLLENYDVRREARDQSAASLRDAKSVVQQLGDLGASASSLVQKSAAGNLRG